MLYLFRNLEYEENKWKFVADAKSPFQVHNYWEYLMLHFDVFTFILLHQQKQSPI